MRSDLLDALGPAERAALVGCLRPRRFRRGQVLFNEGDRGDSMHLLQHGRLAVEASTVDGGVIVLRVVNPGELVGELALLRPGHRRTGRVSALEPAETLVLQRSDFQRLRDELPAIDRFLTEALADRVIRTSQLATEMLLPAETRIWRRLAVLAEAYGPDPIRLSQDTLAHAAGTVRQTANRVVQAGVRDGVLASGRGVISVLDPAAVDRRSAAPGLPPARRS